MCLYRCGRTPTPGCPADNREPEVAGDVEPQDDVYEGMTFFGIPVRVDDTMPLNEIRVDSRPRGTGVCDAKLQGFGCSLPNGHTQACAFTRSLVDPDFLWRTLL